MCIRDRQKLDGTQVGQYLSMWSQGAIIHQTLLEILQRGEILPELDVEAEIEMLEQSKLDGLDLDAAGGSLPAEEEDDEAEDGEGSDAGSEQDSEVRQEVLRRLRAQIEDDSEEETE